MWSELYSVGVSCFLGILFERSERAQPRARARRARGAARAARGARARARACGARRAAGRSVSAELGMQTASICFENLYKNNDFESRGVWERAGGGGR